MIMNILFLKQRGLSLPEEFKTISEDIEVSVVEKFSHAIDLLENGHFDLIMVATFEESFSKEWDIGKIRRITSVPTIYVTGSSVISKEVLLLLIESLQTSKNFNNHFLFESSLRFIEQNLYNDELSLEKVASHAYISKCHYSKLFKKHLGTGYKDYVINKRITKAKSLLRRGYSVTETCYAVGYNDLTHFGRIFKKVVGVSPSVFRQEEVLDKLREA
ncbi:AraC family transcriptional regulator [Bacillus cereus]|uniref:AraC family transcriptional regulator n=2 Tax=Bacillus cereus TaxID=1396 RepID=A0AA44Q8A3_BACCE|nr:AraC family transcriptional regulator [Bacillus cereus]PFR98704.1 AraC family transcriptional regulator [Bacillus cereus]